VVFSAAVKPAFAALAAGLLLPLPSPAQERPQAEPPSVVAQLSVDGDRVPLPVTQGTAGPLFLLGPILLRLGGDGLVVVPIDHSHRFRLAQVDVVLGPGTDVMTVGRAIVTLRQAPIASPAGLWVPLDALQQSYGELMGLDFQWYGNDRVLEVTSRRSREVSLDIQVVHIQGITTVVLQFDHAPTYKVSTRGPVVEIATVMDVPPRRPALIGGLPHGPGVLIIAIRSRIQ